MIQSSEHYLGDKGRAYHQRLRATHWFNATFALQTVLPHLESDDRVLDFGCADGALLDLLPNRFEARRRGEPRFPRDRATERGLTVHESTADIDSDTVDLVVSSHVLEHTLRPLDELIELRRVLSPDGRLVLILPLEDWRAHRDWALPESHHHLYAWTPQLLANLLSEAGFTVRSVDIANYATGRFTKRCTARFLRCFSMSTLGSRRIFQRQAPAGRRCHTVAAVRGHSGRSGE